MYLEIRFCHDVTISYFEDILKKCLILNNSFVNEISFIIKFNNDLYDFLKNNNLGINKFLNIQFHSCSYDSNSQLDNVMFTFTSNKLSIPLSCGIIRKNNFVYSNNFYLESQNHNTCLNKKISIDKDGNIKNCPSMKNIYGNIRNTTLSEVLIIPEFRSFWKINKNEIDVCRDCEFRHICTDCRAYIENPANIYSKPLKCGYDPYTNLWTEWSTNPLKATVIEEYNLQTIINPS
ncbi:grasp-with-spasm system SPASM domain peptide maturase [Flavobacterium hercynium]|nr:grasp-with-spasm system SPASM domain peptide maturase [Flavobacterium hercynium]